MTLRGNKWTLAELVTAVSEALDDDNNGRWSAIEVGRAVRRAVRSARFAWWEERIDSSETYATDTLAYALAPAVEDILEVWFEPITSGNPNYIVPRSLWYREEDNLRFRKDFTDFNGKTVYIRYTVHPTNLLTKSGSDGVATISSGTFTSAGGAFTTAPVPLPGDEIVLTSGADAGTYYIVSVDSATQVTVDRDFGTGSTTVDYYIAKYTDLPYAYLEAFSMAWLYELAGRNRPGVEVADVVQWASYYRQLADLELRRSIRRPQGVRQYESNALA